MNWFGMDIFRATSFDDPSLPGFSNEARTRRKPVMIGETTHLYVGAQNGATSWNGWFVAFFDFLRWCQRPHGRQTGVCPLHQAGPG